MKGVEFLRQPTRCVFSGSVNPLYHLKAMSIFTLSPHGLKQLESVTRWRPTILDFDSGPAVLVDCGSEDEHDVHKMLLSVQLPGIIGWEGPRRSLGSQGAKTRLAFTA